MRFFLSELTDLFPKLCCGQCTLQILQMYCIMSLFALLKRGIKTMSLSVNLWQTLNLYSNAKTVSSMYRAVPTASRLGCATDDQNVYSSSSSNKRNRP